MEVTIAMSGTVSFVHLLQLLADEQAEVRISWADYDWIKRKFDLIKLELDEAQRKTFMETEFHGKICDDIVLLEVAFAAALFFERS